MDIRTFRAHLMMFTSSLFFALNIPAIKILFGGWFTPGEILVYRMTFGALAFWIISLALPGDRIRKKDFLIFAAGGAVGLFGMQALYMIGLHDTSPIDASIILTIPPVLVLLFTSIVYKTKLTGRKIAGILIAMGGALLIILTQAGGGKGGATAHGNLYVLICSVSWAAYLLLTQQVSRRYRPVTLLKWVFLWAALPSWIFFGPGVIRDGFFDRFPTTEIFSVLVFILIFPTVISYLLIPAAMKRLNTTVISMYSYTVPLIASVVSVAMGQAVLRWDQPVAAVLIFVGVYLVNARWHTSAGNARTGRNRVVTR